MSTYIARVNGDVFFTTANPSEKYTLTSAKVNLEAGAAGSFVFTIPPQNSHYGTLKELTDIIDVYRDNELIFSGRIIKQVKKITNLIDVTCEGLLAILNDSIVRPFTHNGTLSDLVTQMLNQHSEQVNTAKQISAGNITVTGHDSSAFRAYEKYETTMSRMKDLVKSYGGYMSIRKESSGLYLDWCDAYSNISTQPIKLGANILTLQEEQTADKIITCIIPLGASVKQADGTSTPLTISSVTADGVDYIKASADAIAKYGLIVSTNTWNDVTTPDQLYSKGLAYMNSTLVRYPTIKVTAADLAESGLTVDKFSLRKKYNVYFTHIVESEELVVSSVQASCNKLALDLLVPTNNKLELGATVASYVNQNSSTISGIADTVEKVVSDYVTNEDVTDAIDSASDNLTAEVVSRIEQNPDSILAGVREQITNDLEERVMSLESWLELNKDRLAYYISVDGTIQRWFEFVEDGFIIKKDDISVYSVQDNEKYQFKSADGTVLLTLDTKGLTASTANVSGQLKIVDDAGTDQWAIRRGTYRSTASMSGYNLDIVWLGDGAF